MRRSLSVITLILISTPLWATAYTVKSGGGGSFTTIQACANTAVAGDSCTVFVGIYNETVTPAHSGTVGNPITFKVNPGDCVTMHGFVIGSLSYITIGTPEASSCVNGTFTYSGFEITSTQGITFSSTNNLIIQNNYVHDVSDICLHGPGTIGQGTATFVYVLNNTLTKCGGPSGLAGGIGMEGNHWLVDGNTFSHVEDGMYAYGSFLVIRRNNFGPVTAAEEGTNHPDAIESTCGGVGVDYPLIHMVFEGNIIHDWRSTNGHGLLLRDISACGQTQNVLRYNQWIVLGSNQISNDGSGGVAGTKTLIYNNSISNMQSDFSPKDFSDLTFTQGGTGMQVINNIFQDNWRPGNSDFCIYADGTSTTGFNENHNLCFLTGFSGSWQTSSFGSYDPSDIFNSDPKFISPTTDLHIQIGSPAIGVGGPLTIAVGAGVSSSSLTVANSAFFSDGYGINGVQGDWIRIGSSTTVQISSVNYSTNVLTLASPQSWSNGAAIYLYKNSTGTIVLNAASPNIGFDQGTSPAPPAIPVFRRMVSF